MNAVVFGSRGLAPTFAGMDRRYWQRKLQVTETKKKKKKKGVQKLQYAKARLGALGPGEKPHAAKLPVVRARRALPHNLLGFVDLETRLIEMLDHPLGELLAGR